MKELLIETFLSNRLIPHGYCLSWNPTLLWTYVATDSIIAISYFSIPFALWYFAKHRPDVSQRWLILLFAIFIVACGLTHILDVINIWSPYYYWANAITRIFTAAASLATAIMLWKIMPQALKAPSALQMAIINKKLEESHSELEIRVEERTRELSQALKESTRFRNALDKISAFVFMKDRNHNYVYANQQTLDFFKCSADELYGKDDRYFLPAETLSQVVKNDNRVIEFGEDYTGEVSLIVESGEKKFYWEIKTPIYDEIDKSRVWGLCGITTDITEKRKSEDLIWEQAYFDTLTRLPNRRLIQDKISQEIKKCQITKTQFVLLFIDLDYFKEVNDTLGHEAGDQLLKQATQRIRNCIRDVDTLGRFAGDEFIILFGEINDFNTIRKIANDIIEKLKLQFELGHEVVYVSASIGITVYPDDGNSVTTLLKNADQAMYTAKREGRARFCFYTPAMQEAANIRMQMVNDMHLALLENQFEVYYQPIIELATGSIKKAEALVRWNHPKLGLISPADFIPIAEETGMIIQLGAQVFEKATQQLVQWRSGHYSDLQISINKSPMQFKVNADEHLMYIQNHLDKLKLNGNSIVIEITEGIIMQAGTEVSQQLNYFRDSGIQVALDDFGTGYSSLSYLQEFDIDYIKIDKSFVSKLAPNSNNLVLCEAMIIMAHKLNIKVIAEGVETNEQRDLLYKAGCDYAQGYLFSKPIPADDFSKLLN
jgi:diguanylate cyclase (GGDEF)-like protein/PAS domain S-box-containing protein